jgi:hypothetical protein
MKETTEGRRGQQQTNPAGLHVPMRTRSIAVNSSKTEVIKNNTGDDLNSYSRLDQASLGPESPGTTSHQERAWRSLWLLLLSP